ncbi:MAG: methenyltetrahydrofolate cyclohydrolase [Methylococcaceae bacterium]|jgi:formiminotetrahydrofolate cyclodeaminase
MIKDQSVEQFLDELASKSATPGGGSAAAIMGAMAGALVSMVCNLTIGKKNHEAVEDEMAQTLLRAEALREQLLDMVRADVAAFDAVMAGYGMPKQTDDEKWVRSTVIQEALKAATDVPLNCAQTCAEVIELSGIVAAKGNRNVVSDAGVAVMAAYAALRSAALNVHVNVRVIKDPSFVGSRLERLERITQGIAERTEEIYHVVKERL